MNFSQDMLVSYASFVHNASAAYANDRYTRQAILTLRKYLDTNLTIGTEIFLVTRDGRVLDGFSVASVLGDLVSLDLPPLEGEKQGFTWDGKQLKPNWCAGRKALIAGLLNRQEAEELASKRK